MKGSSLLVVLTVAMCAVAIAPTIYGLEDSVALTEEQGARLRRLSEVQREEPPEMIAPKDSVVESDEHHAWWHRGVGCSPGSRFWPRCHSDRYLEEEPSEDIAEELPTEGDEDHAPWHGGGGCFPGSRVWPRCRGWGGRGDCFPGARFWPRCKSF